MKRLYPLLLSFFTCISAIGQQTIVTGKITDAATSEPLPYVTVIFKGTNVGAVSDFEGKFRAVTTMPVDSIMAQFVGYKVKVKPVRRGESQVINFQMESDAQQLREFVVRPGVNPAHRIIKNAQNAKNHNNPDKLESYECESFNKIQIAVDNVSDKFKKRKVFKSVEQLFDTVASLSGDDGKPVLPIFISETVSDFYYLKRPKKYKEYIKATKISGVAVEDGSFVSQLLGQTFQQYNFYDNWIRILDKDFVSPIAQSSLLFYKFYLIDSVQIDGVKCFEIQLEPKEKQDLAFTGTVWIADSSWALKRLVLDVGKSANLNFIESLKIQQELISLEDGSWMPAKTRILVDIAQISKGSAGMIATFYSSQKNFTINKPRDLKFFDQAIELSDSFNKRNDEYWQENRHEELSADELKVYKMVDSLKNLPKIRTYVEWVNIIVDGYKSFGTIDVGPYAFLVSYNPLEGVRFRVGARTNALFSKTWVFHTYVAYGLKDEQFKYMGQVEYIASRKHWTVLGAKYRKDVDQIGVTDQNYGAGNLFTSLNLLQANTLNRTIEYKTWVHSQLNTAWSTRLTLHNKYFAFEPIRDFNFAYYENPRDTNSAKRTSFTNSSVTVEMRYAPDELFLLNDNERISMGTYKSPAITLSYTKGFKGIFGSDFEYDKVSLNIAQNLKMGPLGNAKYSLTASKIFGTLPYPILDIQRGNESFVTSTGAYNLMRFFEFGSDQFISGVYEQHFEGIIFNRIPLIKKLKWRNFAMAKGIWGSLSKANQDILPPIDVNNRSITRIKSLEKKPYIEVSYGIENIFKIFRVDFIHRLTYRTPVDSNNDGDIDRNEEPINFGVKFTVQVTF